MTKSELLVFETYFTFNPAIDTRFKVKIRVNTLVNQLINILISFRQIKIY